MKNTAMIQACLECFTACNYCIYKCMEMADKHHLRCISLCSDCAEICALCAKLGIKMSEYSHHLMNLCADICFECAIECDKFPEHEHCRNCAETCKKCAQECIVY